MNRRKILRIGRDFLPVLFGRDTRHCYEVTEGGLPPDTKIVNVRMDTDFCTLVILVESDEFDEATEGMPYPEIEPKFRTIQLPERSTTEASPN